MPVFVQILLTYSEFVESVGIMLTYSEVEESVGILLTYSDVEESDAISKSLISRSDRKLCKRRVRATSTVPFGAAHSLSWQLSSLCEQCGIHVAATSDKSLKDAMILFGSKCAKWHCRCCSYKTVTEFAITP